ncbi:MAG: tryptophan synthase subunit alpha [Victivallales bacterium]|nr:tryptophan synthase subunit alpha [Victivallales bacterium]
MGKSNIKRFFTNREKPAFIAYITAGDPTYEKSIEIVDALVKGGIDMLELGIPFSDPLADGEVNQRSAQRALNSGMTPERCIKLVNDIKAKHKDLPVIFYTYLNLAAYAQDFKKFCAAVNGAGLDGLLLLDLIPEESREYREEAEKNGLGLVALVAPNTKEQRIKKITDYASCFVYYVSREGVTGKRKGFAENVEKKINIIRKYTDLPVVVGFGISSPEHVKAAAESGVDGIVVGSAIVSKIQKIADNTGTVESLKKFVSSLTEPL